MAVAARAAGSGVSVPVLAVPVASVCEAEEAVTIGGGGGGTVGATLTFGGSGSDKAGFFCVATDATRPPRNARPASAVANASTVPILFCCATIK